LSQILANLLVMNFRSLNESDARMAEAISGKPAGAEHATPVTTDSSPARYVSPDYSPNYPVELSMMWEAE